MSHAQVLVIQHFPAEFLAHIRGSAFFLDLLLLFALHHPGDRSSLACGRDGQQVSSGGPEGVLDYVPVDVLELYVAGEGRLLYYLKLENNELRLYHTNISYLHLCPRIW